MNTHKLVIGLAASILGNLLSLGEAFERELEAQGDTPPSLGPADGQQPALAAVANGTPGRAAGTTPVPALAGPSSTKK